MEATVKEFYEIMMMIQITLYTHLYILIKKSGRKREKEVEEERNLIVRINNNLPNKLHNSYYYYWV